MLGASQSRHSPRSPIRAWRDPRRQGERGRSKRVRRSNPKFIGPLAGAKNLRVPQVTFLSCLTPSCDAFRRGPGSEPARLNERVVGGATLNSKS